MQVVDKLMMFGIVVKDMQKAKEFYGDKLGLEVVKDYRQDDEHWWVSLNFPEGNVTITLTTYSEDAVVSALTLWLGSADLAASHKELSDKGVTVSDIGDDLHGPGSGVKWFNFSDPDGNIVHIEQI
jgi:catechol 2,3-dioxygenase-like lactoylglutathione lyase family enzyme